MALRRGRTRRPRKLAADSTLTEPGASEKDFSEAPIFKMYGPSPSMVKQVKWRSGASIAVREKQRKARE